MAVNEKSNGCPFGTHRVMEPKNVLPQPALKIDNNMDYMWDNEIMVNVMTLNIDSASFTQIKEEQKGNEENIKRRILEIVNQKGKMQNPVTGSGGMFIGKVFKIGSKLKGKIDLKEGDKIASLVSLSLTPLKINKILGIKKGTEQVNVEAKAVLFESGIYAKIPKDIPEKLALAVLDVAGAPAQTDRLVKPGDTVVIIGGGGKSGILCSYSARNRAGVTGKVIGIEYSDAGVEKMKKMGFCDFALKLDATNAVSCYKEIHKITDGKMADVVINCVNVPNTEMSSILMTRERGTVYFFSMATSFTKAALGAEGVGKDIDMIIGNGYMKGHAEISLDILRKSKIIRKEYEKHYA
ncbi:MAG: zinc-binding dehydrogenase [Elusimicrobiales bacterium]|nr:zinc-binding dehydrogenase [Elusimicrobiales bacterium]HOL63111.1 zinc-binding dehydrogenase [Elusimicrobiales bacterium]HPO96279.1 zinc-binding dehydrogenase [Elusimicrobiales bacterium]